MLLTWHTPFSAHLQDQCPAAEIVANLLVMIPLRTGSRVVVFNAARGFPDTAELISTATRALADVIVLLRFSTEKIPAGTVRRWVRTSSALLCASSVHLVTFNTDLGLALGRRLDLSAGLHDVAPHFWLVVRRWAPPGQLPSLVTFVGPSTLGREGISGSLWADELLKPEDLTMMRPSELVIADLESTPTVPVRRMPGAHSPSMLHPFLGRAVVQRASARTVWAAAPEGPQCLPGRLRPGEHAIVGLGQRS